MDWQAALLVRAKVGHTKTYWEQAPQNTTLPYVTLLDVTQLRPQLLKGWDLEAARVQIDVWATTPGGTGNGHTFQRADVAMGPRDIAGEKDGTTPIFRKTADLMIHHTTA
jgi:hypothetical protein